MSDRSIPVLRCAELSKSYGKSAVLERITFDLPQGRFAGLVGVNGAGKTTLIKCILDFCDFQSGRIELFGRAHHAPGARRDLAYLPEKFVPPYFLTGREFLEIMPALDGRARAGAGLEDMLAELELDPAALDRPVHAYSKGMVQKLGLAACLLAARKLVVLDEPMSGLDPLARIRVKRQLEKLRQRGDTTLLMTSHSLADIGEICDHMLVLHAGHLLYSGSPEAFRQQRGAGTLEDAFLTSIEGTDG